MLAHFAALMRMPLLFCFKRRRWRDIMPIAHHVGIIVEANKLGKHYGSRVRCVSWLHMYGIKRRNENMS